MSKYSGKPSRMSTSTSGSFSETEKIPCTICGGEHAVVPDPSKDGFVMARCDNGTKIFSAPISSFNLSIEKGDEI